MPPERNRNANAPDAARSAAPPSAASPTTAAKFTFAGIALPDAEDPLGIWRMASVAPEAYAAPAAPESVEGLRWRIDLPAEERDAQRALRRRLAAAKAREADLDKVARRMSELVVPAAYALGPGANALAVPSVGPAEASLLAEVEKLYSAPMAYAGDRESLPRRLLAEKANQLLLQFRRLVQYYARIEITVGGRLVGLTVVDWSGDFQTTWQGDVGPAEMTLHLDGVRLALASRQALLRLVGVVTTGALSLAATASVPGGQLLLLPAVYKYVRDVLAELAQYADSKTVTVSD